MTTTENPTPHDEMTAAFVELLDQAIRTETPHGWDVPRYSERHGAVVSIPPHLSPLLRGAYIALARSAPAAAWTFPEGTPDGSWGDTFAVPELKVLFETAVDYDEGEWPGLDNIANVRVKDGYDVVEECARRLRAFVADSGDARGTCSYTSLELAAALPEDRHTFIDAALERAVAEGWLFRHQGRYHDRAAAVCDLCDDEELSKGRVAAGRWP